MSPASLSLLPGNPLTTLCQTGLKASIFGCTLDEVMDLGGGGGFVMAKTRMYYQCCPSGGPAR